MVCECEEDPDTRGYARYYDYPEGEATAQKAMVAARYGILTGLVFSTYDILMYSHATGLGNIISRYLMHTMPLGLMGATFAVVSNELVNYREKNDHWNYFLGGAACGPILARYLAPRTKHAILLPCSLLLGAVAAVKKEGIMQNHTFVPVLHSHMGTVWSPKNDWTLAKDPKIEAIKNCGIHADIGPDGKEKCM